MPFAKLMPRYRLRPGKVSDAPAIFAVHDRAIRVLGRGIYSETQVESWAHGNKPQRYVEAMNDGEIFEVAVSRLRGIVGFCSYKADEIRSLYVDPDWSRLGLGKELLRNAEAAVAAAGHGKVIIGASLVGLPFYEAQGYRVVRHRHWRTRGGLMIPAADMEKALGDEDGGRASLRRRARRTG